MSHFGDFHTLCICAMSQCSRRCINTTSGIFSRKNARNAYHWDAGVHTVRFVVGYDRSKHQCQRNRRRYQSKVHHLRKWHNGNIIKDVTKRRRKSVQRQLWGRSKVLSILRIFSLMNCLASERLLALKMLCQVFLKGRFWSCKPELILIYTNKKVQEWNFLCFKNRLQNADLTSL